MPCDLSEMSRKLKQRDLNTTIDAESSVPPKKQKSTSVSTHSAKNNVNDGKMKASYEVGTEVTVKMPLPSQKKSDGSSLPLLPPDSTKKRHEWVQGTVMSVLNLQEFDGKKCTRVLCVRLKENNEYIMCENISIRDYFDISKHDLKILLGIR